ncbi:MAG: hypothetical protein J6I31_00730 [Prevotella sp.]|nr:hypothetical protein [Prevotella sp.]
MKKLLLVCIAILAGSTCFGQKINFQQAQTRVIEPMQDVYVRPLVADLEILKGGQRQKYMRSPQFTEKKFSEITVADLEDAKILATYAAAVQDDADVIVGATYKVTNHIDEKGKPSEYGIDIVVSGYPARYTNWHKMGDDPKDEKWVPRLFDGQSSRRVGGVTKTDAVKAK